MDAIVEVVRCFEDRDITHVSDELHPLTDIETIATELLLADIESLGRQRERLEKSAKGGDMNKQMKRWLENAIFIGFTGTPLLRRDRQMTRDVFSYNFV